MKMSPYEGDGDKIIEHRQLIGNNIDNCPRIVDNCLVIRKLEPLPSIFFSDRIGDEGGNATEIIGQSVDWLGHWEYKSKIIVGSIRSVAEVLSVAMAGVHIITIPPQFLLQMVDHKYTRATVAQFIDDARKR